MVPSWRAFADSWIPSRLRLVVSEYLYSLPHSKTPIIGCPNYRFTWCSLIVSPRVLTTMTGYKNGILRWFVNTAAWNPTRTEWVVAMRLVGCDEERNRINRFVYKRDAKHALVGRLLIRKCCNHFCGVGTFNTDSTDRSRRFLTRSEKGKPILIEGGY